MGLFDKIKQTADTAKNRVDIAKSQVTQAKYNLTQAVDTVTGKADTRPYAPQPFLAHLQHECIEAYGARYHQDVLRSLNVQNVHVTISKRKNAEHDSYPVALDNGSVVGYVYDDGLGKAGLQPGCDAIAEVVHPIYQTMEYVKIYIPRTQKVIEEQKFRENLKLWINVNGDKWQGGLADRYDFDNVEVLNNGKNYVILGNGQKLFEVSPRMKCYQDIEERAKYKSRRLIVEKKQNDMGIYYRAGFYY